MMEIPKRLQDRLALDCHDLEESNVEFHPDSFNLGIKKTFEEITPLIEALEKYKMFCICVSLECSCASYIARSALMRIGHDSDTKV